MTKAKYLLYTMIALMLCFSIKNVKADVSLDSTKMKNIIVDTSGKYVVPKDSVLISINMGKEEDYSNLIISGIVSLLVAAIVLFIQVKVNKRQKKKEEDIKYKNCLETIKNELSFYRLIFGQLSEHFVNIVELIKKREATISTPTYNIYPQFLENSKIELSSFMRNPEIVTGVSHCHYTLSLICEGLNIHRQKLQNENEVINGYLLIENLNQFIDEINRSGIDFKDSISKIDNEINKIKKNIYKKQCCS